MTPREIKDALYKASELRDANMALRAADELRAQKLMTSTSHWSPTEPDGTEIEIVAKKPGTCVFCYVEFKPGETIRWRSRVACHVACWAAKYGS
jgi:hypothetical protein